MLAVKGKTTHCLHAFNIDAAPVGTMWEFQQNGWMIDVIGEKWFNQVSGPTVVYIAHNCSF